MNTLIYNANIVTMDEANPQAEAALIVNETFAFVGGREEALRYAKEEDVTFAERDMKGKSILPGFNDAHLHFLHYVKAKASVNLFDATSLAEVLHRMTAATTEHDTESPFWIVGEGWNQDYFEGEKRFPTKADLDTISPDVPMLLMRACFHLGVLNSAGLRQMSHLLETAPAELADRDESGEWTGIVRESLFDDIKSSVPAPSVDDLLKDLIDAQVDLFRHGITSIQSDDKKYVPERNYLEFYHKLAQASADGDLKVRFGLQVLVDSQADLTELIDNNLPQLNQGRVHFSCVKLLADGSLGARTAYLRQPYHDDPNTQGIRVFTDEELRQMVETAHCNNLPVAIHAIGDGAMDQVLTTIEAVQAKHPDHSPRHGIVHAQITDESIIKRIREANITVFAQPIFISYDMHMVTDRVGEDLATTSYAWKSMLDQGISVAFSTDSPVEPFDTMPNLYTAVSRKDLSGRGPYLPKEALRLSEAIYCYTANAAYVEHRELEKGKISPGQLADFVVTEEDFLNLNDSDLLTAKIYQTYISGECVYSLE